MTVPATTIRRPDLVLADYDAVFRDDPARAVARLRSLLQDPTAVEECCRFASAAAAIFGGILPLRPLAAGDFERMVDVLAGQKPAAAVRPDLLPALLADATLTRRAAAALRTPPSSRRNHLP